MPDFSFQPSFPIASVIDAAQRNNALQQQAKEYGQQQLQEGLKSIGDIGQSLLQRRMAMAQALAASKLYAATPEGQQALGTNPVAQGPAGMPITKAQTAAGGPNQPPTPNATGIDMGTLQTAFLGESPSNLLTQLYERQKQQQEFGLQQRKQAFEEQIKPEQLAATQALQKALLGFRGQQLNSQEQKNIQDELTAIQGRQSELVKDLPSGIIDSFKQNILPDPKYQAAYAQYQALQQRYDTLNRVASGSKGSSNGPNISVNLPGLSIE